ncbi:hypothetical protein EVAR_59818_1 [Eumeta japonica]|uniref:Uncharacterized protein n=1 Tax=Eumeta variegata TaxID=151549 RepID=A0A4C1ZD67_EUMVA|nr:hypothetical protein EVAR_59818_1 [Eumeta japonica]
MSDIRVRARSIGVHLHTISLAMQMYFSSDARLWEGVMVIEYREITELVCESSRYLAVSRSKLARRGSRPADRSFFDLSIYLFASTEHSVKPLDISLGHEFEVSVLGVKGSGALGGQTGVRVGVEIARET